jgi:hypothetical protein
MPRAADSNSKGIVLLSLLSLLYLLSERDFPLSVSVSLSVYIERLKERYM